MGFLCSDGSGHEEGHEFYGATLHPTCERKHAEWYRRCMRLRALALPNLDEVRRELPALLAASGELVPRPFPGELDGPLATLSVSPWLSPAWSNPDFEPDLTAFPELERAFLARQIERTHRDDLLTPVRSQEARWLLTELSVAPLTDWSNRDDATGVLLVEVPVFTTDRRHAALRGQRHGLEDFAHWLQKTDGRWTSM